MRAGPQRRINPYLTAILALSVVLRVVVALYLGDEVDAPSLLTDQRSYHALGARLVAGHGLSFEGDWYPFTLAGVPTAHWSFLYSLFVAAVYALFSPHPLAARLVQAVLGGILLPWAVYRLAKAVWRPSSKDEPSTNEREGVALLAAGVAALYIYFALYAATLMTETLYITVLLWSLERAIALAERLRAQEPLRALWPTALGLGASLGVAAPLRQSILPWMPVISLFLLWVAWRAGQLRTALLSLVLVGAVIVACILPFTIRNYLVYDQFLLLNSNAGFAMYSAQHPMHGTRFREFEAAPLPEGSWGRSEPDLDRELMRRGIQFILDEPGRYLLLSLSRVRAFFEFWPTPDTTLLHNVGRTGSFGLLLPFLLYGLFLVVRSPRHLGRCALLLLFAAFYTVLHLLTWAMVRYRLPVDAALMPVAALGLADVLHRLRALLPRRLARLGTKEPA